MTLEHFCIIGVNSAPPKFISIQNLWMWPCVEQGLCKCNQVKMKSYRIRVGPKPKSSMTGVLRRGNLDTETHRENATWWWRQRLQRWVYKPRIADNHQKRARGKEGSFPRTFRKVIALPTPWFQTSNLQNYEIIHFCCLKLPSLWYFVMAALWNWYAPPTQFCSFLLFLFHFTSPQIIGVFFLTKYRKRTMVL